MSTILITGLNGLIGKSLYQYLLEKSSYQLKGLDIKFPHSHPSYGDINNFDSIQNHLENCDGIIHLAGVSRVVWGEKQPEYCWQTNVIGTQHILEAAYKSSYKPWVIYASSREVYGQQQQFPVIESARLQPLNHYARSKVAAEELIQQYQAKGLRTAILRFSSVYGRVDDYRDRVTPAFCRAAAFNEPLRIEGLQNTFDFTHVEDVVRGIVKTVNKLEQGQTLPPIHLTTGVPTTLQQLAELACTINNSTSEIIELPPRNYDVTKFYGDPGLARKYLDWIPQIDVTTGVNQLVTAFCRANYLKENQFTTF